VPIHVFERLTFLDTLKQVYTDCQAAVDVNGTCSDFFDILSSGVK